LCEFLELVARQASQFPAILILVSAGAIVRNFVGNFVEKSDEASRYSTKFPIKAQSSSD
jgi:hypothetical protein